MASPGLVPGEPRFFTSTDRYRNNGASAGLVPAERKIFAGRGEPNTSRLQRLIDNLGTTGTRPVEAVNFGRMRL